MRDARSIVVPLLVLVAVAGCVARLAPAPEAVLAPGRPDGAVAEVAGVRIVARPNAWHGFPEDLVREVTPILVTIENGSAAPLRVRYEDFALEAPAGGRFAAVSPFDITGTMTDVVPAASIGPRFSTSFGLAYGFGPRFGWHPFLYDPYPYYYDPFYEPYFRRQIALPTGDMVQMALPENVIEPGTRATGFLYFPRLRDVERVTFRAPLVHARTGEPIGVASIPFVVD